MTKFGVYVGTVLIGLGASACGASTAEVDTLRTQVDELRVESEAYPTKELHARVDSLATKLSEAIGRLESHDHGGDASAAPSGPKVEPPPEPASPPPPPETTVWEDVDAILGLGGKDIEQRGDTYIVSGPWLERALRRLALSDKGPKLSPTDDGIGVKGFKPGSVLGQLGLKNNDVILRVGGKSVKSLQELSEALKALESPAEVEVKRRKQTRTLRYSLK